MHEKRSLCQGGMNPPQRRDFVSSIAGARRKGTYRGCQMPLDSRVPPMQAPSRGNGLVERAEHHAENDPEGSMKAPNRISECP